MSSSDKKTPAETVLPLPSTAFIAAGFLSQHIFPDEAISKSPVASSITFAAASEAIVAIFIPIASPVLYDILTYTLVPAVYVEIPISFP